jgi:hypothetical protein
MGKPSAGFRRGKKFGDCRIECAWLFSWNIVAASREHQQPGCRHDLLEKNAASDAGFVFVTNDNKQRY